jgi:uncharacterized protein
MKMCLRLALLMGLCASAVGAVDWNALKPQGYVSDFARVVDPASRVHLDVYCGAVERSTGAEIAIVIIPSLEGEPVADVAQTLYRAWAVGKKNRSVGQKSQAVGPKSQAGRQKNQGGGVLVLMAVQDRRVHVTTAGGLESILPESRVLREMRPALRERDLGEAAMAAAETIGLSLFRFDGAGAGNPGFSASLPRRLRPGAFDWFPWPVLIGAVFLLAWLMRMGGVRGDGGSTGGGLLRGFGGRAMARSTWGSNGSGGFGGYDSGDGGFGGFGGGDCPGGNASDW